MPLLSDLAQALEAGDRSRVEVLTARALQENVSPDGILKEGLFAGMDVVGARFKSGDIYIPHVLIAARAMHAGLEILRPHLIRTGAKPAGTFIIGTVQGDHHDIGKNLVAMMLQGKGFEVIRPGRQRSVGAVRPGLEGSRGEHSRHVRPALHHASLHEGDDRGHLQGGPEGHGQDHGRWRARDPGVCRPNRCGRLWAGRHGGGRKCLGAAVIDPNGRWRST